MVYEFDLLKIPDQFNQNEIRSLFTKQEMLNFQMDKLNFVDGQNFAKIKIKDWGGKLTTFG